VSQILSKALAARVREIHERWRAVGYRDVIELLSSKARLRAGVTPERATHLLLLNVGMDVYRVLVEDFGWTHPQWVDWAVDTIVEQVFAKRGGSPRSP